MKQTMLSAAVAAALLLGTTGCGDNKAESKTVQQVKETTAKMSLSERKAAFDTKIKAFSAYGFDVNQTKPDSYMLTVENEKQAVASLLNMLNMSTMESEERAPIEQTLKNAKIGVDIDWNKYAANEKESVFVYYLGNGKEAPYIAKLFAEKKIAAYLSYNGEDQLKQVKVKDIDETITVDKDKTHVVLKGMHAKIKKNPTKTTTDSAYDLYGGTLNYEITDTENNDTLIFSYKDPECNIAKTNAYLGKQQCTFPTFDINFKSTSQDKGTVQASIKDTSFTYNTTAHDKKVKGELNFKISSISIKGKGTSDSGRMTINDIRVTGNTDNMDEAVLKSYMAFLNNPPKENNETIKQMMSFVGKMYSTGMTFDYTVSVASAKGESSDGTFALDAYEGHGKGSFSDTINYKEVSSVKSITAIEKKSKKPFFALKNFRFGYGISDLYNFIPVFMEFSGAVAAQGQAENAQLPADVEKKLTDMGMKLVHNGFGFSLDPVGWDTLQAEAKGKSTKLGRVDLNIDARLKKNDVPLDANNPMSAMMLIPYFEADGKLVLSKKDLEQLSKTMPPQMIGMLMMFAKFEGENAVFVLKFENGHMTINGQPVM